MISQPLHNWENFDTQTIMGGKSRDGQRYLKLFLQDYTALFGGKVNPSCSKCIKNYLNKYKSKLFDMDSNCDYKLHKRFNGIQMGFGSNKILSNNNLTNELAQRLIEKHKAIHEKKGTKFNISFLFQKYPKDWDKKAIEVIEVEQPEVIEAPKKKRKPRKKSE